MCGIAGELRFRNSKGRADWDRISRMMQHRGPDDAGFWSDNGGCTLVFRRLAILDLSPAGHQPMVSEDGRYVITFNGEVYNFQELRRELVKQGRRFRSTGDSEVVLYALIEWGRTALDKLNGMFALAFYDVVEKRLLLARDHAGIKPLYYLMANSGLVFASQYDQLLIHPWSKQFGVCREALGLYLRLAFVPAPYAILENTHMLEPGSWLEIDALGHIQSGRYYEFPTYTSSHLVKEEAIEAVDSVITEAVKRQLVSDVPVGAFLSGGVDSPLVVSKMKAVGHTPIRAFTIGTSGDVTDESEDAIAYARDIGVEHVLEHVTPEQAVSFLDDVIDACGEPFGDYSIFPTMLVSRLASRDFKVMLSGDGGDELFWGYAKRAATLIGAATDFSGPHWWRLLRWGTKKYFALGDINHAARRYKSLGHWQRSIHTHLPGQTLRSIFPTLPDWPDGFDAFDYTGHGQDETAEWLRRNEFSCHLTMVLQKVDRASMYHSLEVRVPLLDKEVIEVACKVDWRSSLDLQKVIGKLPLRHCLSGHVRHQTLTKRGFAIPMGEWLKTSLRSTFEESLLGRDELLGLEIDRKAFGNLFCQHLDGPHDLGWGLWPLLSLALWAERHYRPHRLT